MPARHRLNPGPPRVDRSGVGPGTSAGGPPNRSTPPRPPLRVPTATVKRGPRPRQPPGRASPGSWRHREGGHGIVDQRCRTVPAVNRARTAPSASSDAGTGGKTCSPSGRRTRRSRNSRRRAGSAPRSTSAGGVARGRDLSARPQRRPNALSARMPRPAAGAPLGQVRHHPGDAERASPAAASTSASTSPRLPVDADVASNRDHPRSDRTDRERLAGPGAGGGRTSRRAHSTPWRQRARCATRPILPGARRQVFAECTAGPRPSSSAAQLPGRTCLSPWPPSWWRSAIAVVTSPGGRPHGRRPECRGNCVVRARARGSGGW